MITKNCRSLVGVQANPKSNSSTHIDLDFNKNINKASETKPIKDQLIFDSCRSYAPPMWSSPCSLLRNPKAVCSPLKPHPWRPFVFSALPVGKKMFGHRSVPPSQCLPVFGFLDSRPRTTWALLQRGTPKLLDFHTWRMYGQEFHSGHLRRQGFLQNLGWLPYMRLPANIRNLIHPIQVVDTIWWWQHTSPPFCTPNPLTLSFALFKNGNCLEPLLSSVGNSHGGTHRINYTIFCPISFFNA